MALVIDSNAKKTTANSSALVKAQQAATAAKKTTNSQYAPTAGFSSLKKTTNSPSPAPKPSPTNSNQPSGGQSYSSGAPSQAPVNSGYDQDAYRKALIDSKKGAINAEYETNASIIKNNLTRALASLNQNKAALEPLYQRQLSSIAQNQFNTSETTKEIMNQGGWNASNSGLAVGEQTKIANTADTQRSESLQAKTTAENEYNSQMSTEQMAADESLGALKKWRSAQLSAAEADALVTSTEYGRALYESDRDFAFTQKQFEESVRQFEVQLAESRASRTASQKAAVAKSTSDGSASSEYSKYLGALYSSNVVNPKEAEDLLETAISDPTIPDNMKEDMISQYYKWVTAYNVKQSNATPTGSTISGITPDYSTIG